jgi:pyrroline-5-carboxylate reductase
MLRSTNIAFIGGGNMSEALIKGLIAGGVPAAAITVAEPLESRRVHLANSYGIIVTDDNIVATQQAPVVILAVKPQVAPSVFYALSTSLAPDTLLISVMAGITSHSIERPFSVPVRVVRVMPNTPALALAGATAIAAGSSATAADLTLAQEIFSLVGKTWIVEEKLMDAVTGLSGSGPAYVLSFIEAMSDAAVKHGLSRDTALGLAAQTVLGTAQLLLNTGEHPAVLRDKVTSPGGTTIAGLYALATHGFNGTVMAGVEAAILRSKELAGK